MKRSPLFLKQTKKRLNNNLLPKIMKGKNDLNSRKG
ncbi:MAG: hypothetical protein ACI9FW_000647, partial [Flavobacterium sp.]